MVEFLTVEEWLRENKPYERKYPDWVYERLDKAWRIGKHAALSSELDVIMKELNVIKWEEL